MINLLQGRRLIDLSVTLDNNPGPTRRRCCRTLSIRIISRDGRKWRRCFRDWKNADAGRGGLGLGRLTVTPHNGTHMDAPRHYSSTTNGGEPAFGIDELPLEWCLRPGVRLDFRHVADGAILQPEDLQRELARIDYCLSPLDIVLINTAAGARYGQPDYLQRGCGIGRAATLWLLEQGYGWLAPTPELGCTLPLYPRTLSGQRRRRADLGGHKAGRRSPMGKWRS